MDPNGLGASRLAADVLWSDPVGEPGFRPNVARGVGMVFGPDVTEVGRACCGGGSRRRSAGCRRAPLQAAPASRQWRVAGQ